MYLPWRHHADWQWICPRKPDTGVSGFIAAGKQAAGAEAEYSHLLLSGYRVLVLQNKTSSTGCRTMMSLNLTLLLCHTRVKRLQCLCHTDVITIKVCKMPAPTTLWVKAAFRVGLFAQPLPWCLQLGSLSEDTVRNMPHPRKHKGHFFPVTNGSRRNTFLSLSYSLTLPERRLLGNLSPCSAI